MKSDRPPPVAIVGGGFSGVMVATQLVRRGIDSVIVEGGGRSGHGTAFSTTEPAHLLNVRAGNMSAWPDDASNFVRFIEPFGQGAPDFAERRLFGRYLRSILDEAVAGGGVTMCDQKAVDADTEGAGWRIRLKNGDVITASAVVLAIGNQAPEPFRGAGSNGRCIDNPWGEEAKVAIAATAASGEDVLLIGTGLTMVDLVLSLDEAGHRGRIVALSRRGLVPRAHAEAPAAEIDADEVPRGSVRTLWRWLRGKGAELGWRSAIDGLRPHSQALWQSLPVDEQRRFLRHARPWWDVHRHRIAPQVAQRIRQLIADGRLEVIAGRISEIGCDDDGLQVRYRRRGRADEQLARFGYMFNCTGPLHSISHTRDRLLRSLLDSGQVRPDHLGIGIEVDDRSRAAGAERLWAVGPLTKGRYWEIIAVPDIRVQAAAVAEDIARELGR